MGGAVSAGENNDDLIDNLLEADYIKNSSVEGVFRAVDRAHYLTDECKNNAYKDLAWKSGNLHISAPCIYSEVMESLKLSPGLSFLNLGSGTGYLSTMAGLILGPYGVNHGVEIHEDVTRYARERLVEFCKKSSALDRYEFCKPKFVQGNCLNINVDERQYDRVYCGAACPEHHENYMKNLIKIGGVLVMPLNDQLLQVIRTSETTWDVKSVLPVSFASLIVPTQSSVPDTVKLPDSEPLCLQDICRSTIRCLLRAKVEQEHPDLKTHRRAPKSVWKKKAMRRFVVPIFEESDDTNEYPAGDFVRYGQAGLFFDMDGDPNHVGTVVDWARSLGMNRVRGIRASAGPDPVPDPGDPAATEDPAEARLSPPQEDDNKEVHKRVKFDSGLGEDIENGKGLSSESDDNSSPESDSDSEASDAVPIGRLWNRGCGHKTRATFRPKVLSSLNRTSSQGSGGEDSDENSPHSSRDATYGSDEDNARSVDPDLYGTYMRCKIQALPLPMQLKSYLNLYRDF